MATKNSNGGIKGTIVLVVIVLAIIGAVTGSGKSGSGGSSGSGVRVDGCDLSQNPDGSVHAHVTLENSGSSSEQANVVIKLHLYGGKTMDDEGLLPSSYDVPPGTQYIGHTFDLNEDQTPVDCTASIPF